jgi:23S rRNA pseudouridine2605 synthase
MMSRVKRGLVRLDRALSKLGLASRAEAKRLIADGRVRVAGSVIRDPAMQVTPEHSRISVDGRTVGQRQWRMIAFHKPRGVVTTRRDPQGRPTVFDMLGDEGRSLVAVGRLDMASTGLLLLTTDTQLADSLTDPQHAIVRRYVVTVRGALHDADAASMISGINELRASSVVVRKRSARETHLIVELVEGKNREIRRMLETLGHSVTKLMRVAFGPIELGNLQPGEWREVSELELSVRSGRRARNKLSTRRRGGPE